jgi:hypothetical protein
MSRQKSKTRFFSATPGRLLVVLVVVIALVLILEVSDTTHIFHKQKAVSGTIKTIPYSPKQPAQTETSDTNTASVKSSTVGGGSQNAKNGASSSSDDLVAPSGTFVSNHKPGQNGTPTKEQSLCNTTAKATCYIKFVQGTVIRTLPAQTADNSGSSTWLWDLSEAGLTTGSWKVSAIATLNGQTKTTDDPIALEVQ